MSQQYGNAFIFQDDNARPHRARIVDDHMAHHEINRMEWPAASPDLNPIENLWEKLGRDMRTAVGPDTTLLQLQPILVNAWNNIPHAYITNLINSMRRRCQQCIASRGSYTSYCTVLSLCYPALDIGVSVKFMLLSKAVLLLLIC